MPLFLVDSMLGNLARFLRLLGFDAACLHDRPDAELVEKALEEGRLIVTRDLELSRTNAVKTFYLEPKELKEQVRLLIRALKLDINENSFFTRCLECNEKLRKIDRNEAAGKVPDKSYRIFSEFYSCPACGRVYWKGTHYRELLKKIDGILKELP